MGNMLTGVLAAGSTRRIIALGVGVLALLLSKHLGLELSELDKELLTTMVVTYFGQSAWKEATLEKARIAGTAAAEDVAALPPPSKLEFLKAQLAEEEARLKGGQS